jgi:hypothetical protein
MESAKREVQDYLTPADIVDSGEDSSTDFNNFGNFGNGPLDPGYDR